MPVANIYKEISREKNNENIARPFSIELEDVEIQHPVELITREMSKKELKKFKNGKLHCK